jgi:Tfp pilus assembly protein PilX
MPRQREARAHLRQGFVLPVVMGLIVIAGLVALHAATGLGTQSVLATTRLLHQRAFEAGESGVVAAIEQLAAGEDPPALQVRASAAVAADRAQVSFTHVASVSLPEGHSAGRIVESHDEIRSEGQSARNARVAIVQGIRRTQVVARP